MTATPATVLARDGTAIPLPVAREDHVQPAPPRHAARYRPEIDGLRAVAVVPVVLYHLGVGWVPGGFVGVDVFFVISGFLITGILLHDMAGGRHSLLRFYERRARRILPNLYAMIAFATVLALVLLIPLDLIRFGQSVLATLGFSSNVLFWLRTGYFEPAAEQLPLLHTWSLGVEEQYYLVFPVALALVRRSRRLMLAMMLGSAVLSLGLAQWQVTHAPEAAFYLPFSRWWELMVGSLLAALIPPRYGEEWGWLLSLAGLGAIVGAIAGYGPHTPFPGLAALLPCLGAAAILLGESGGLSPVGRLLATAPLRWIGLGSYALYLWHWPVIVFGRYVLQRGFTAPEILVALLVIAALSALSYRLVETPMRAVAWSRGRLFAAVGAGAALLAVPAALALGTKGLPQRYPPALRVMADGTELTNPDRHMCDSPSPGRIASGGVCVIGAPGVVPSFALVGDSFADAMAPGFAQAARRAGVAGLVYTFSGCSVLAGAGTTPRCRALADTTFAAIAADSRIHTVALLERWTALADGRREGLFPRDGIWLRDDATRVPGIADNRRVLARALHATIAMLAPRRVTVVYGMPEQPVFVPQYATIRALVHWPTPGLARARYDARQAPARALLQRVLPGDSLLDLGPAMCDATQCPVTAGLVPLYVDDNHPSRAYALRLAPVLIPAIAR